MSLTSRNFIIKQNDTLPALQVTIIDMNCLGGKEPFCLDSVSAVTFTMVDSCGNAKVSMQPAGIYNSSGGTVQYIWSCGDTDENGKFSGEFQLYFNGGGKMSVPQDGSINVEILKEISNF